MTTLAEVIARHYPSGYTCGCGIEINSPGGWGEHVAEDVRAWLGDFMNRTEVRNQGVERLALTHLIGNDCGTAPDNVNACSNCFGDSEPDARQVVDEIFLALRWSLADDHETVDGRCPGRGSE